MDQATYAREAEAFLGELELERYSVALGENPALEPEALHARYAELFSERAVRALLDAPQAEPARSLAAFALDRFLQRHVHALSQEIDGAESTLTVEWDGREEPYRKIPSVLVAEKDRARRAELARRYYAKSTGLNPIRVRRFNQLHSAARSLGFADYVDSHDRVRAIGLRRLAEQAEWVMDVTVAGFGRELQSRLESRGIPWTSASAWDVAFILQSAELDPVFPPTAMLPALRRTLSGLGFDLDALATVQLHTKGHLPWTPSAQCCAVAVPDDIRLVVHRVGGVPAWSRLFREAGRAVRLGLIPSDLDRPARRPGDPAIGDAYAFLFEQLLLEPAWLEGTMGLHSVECQEAAEAAHFRFLWEVRRTAAALNYELELHGGLVDAKAGAYVFWLQRGCGVRMPPEGFLADVQDGFQVAFALRGWILAAQLRSFLRQEFGTGWYSRRQAGDFLRSLSQAGSVSSVDGILRQIGAPCLDPAPLVSDLTR